MPTPSREQRDKNLEELKKAFDEMSEKESTRLKNENGFLRSWLQARNANDAAVSNLLAGSTLVQVAADEFLKTK